MYLLDTNHCSRIIFGDETLCQRVNQVGDSEISTHIIVAGELIFMAQKSTYKAANLAKVTAFLEDITLYFIPEATAHLYGQLKAELIDYFGPKEKAKKRKFTINQLGISDNDLWIAATAIQENLIMVSQDEDFLRIQQVRDFSLENWLI